MSKTPQSQDELNAHLEEQLGFLRRSADAYDSGFKDEAKRLAVTIRVLVHDTAFSKSLLGQLGKKNMLFWDTVVPNEPGNLMPFAALIQMAAGPAGAEYVPYLDDPLPAEAPPAGADFEKWWKRIVFLNQARQALSRKDLVLAVANQDGGAHVDSELNEVYAKLSRENSMGWVFQREATHYAVKPPELAAVRQIAHEILKTFDPSMDKHPSVPEGCVLMAGGSLRMATPEEVAELQRAQKK